MATDKITVPLPKPFTRQPIKPVARHKDKKNDHQRAPKHKKEEL